VESFSLKAPLKKIDMNQKKVLFVCIHNSARSQMAEAFLNSMAGNTFHAESAGIEPGLLNPIVVGVMKDAGIDISSNKTKSVQRFIEVGHTFDYVITVCDEASAERCPVFPGDGKRIHMGFEDPSSFAGSDEEKFIKTAEVRDQIRDKIQKWIEEHKND